eukprot:gene34678-42772_t
MNVSNGKCIYTGQWVKGEMSGSGTMTWADGGVYVGEWSKNNFHGFGTMTFEDGRVFSASDRNIQIHLCISCYLVRLAYFAAIVP